MIPGGVAVVVKMDGPPKLCKADEIGEICLHSHSGEGTSYFVVIPGCLWKYVNTPASITVIFASIFGTYIDLLQVAAPITDSMALVLTHSG